MSKQLIKVGIKFKSIHADSYAEWVVTASRGDDTWQCEIQADADYAGTKRVFGGEEIRAALTSAKMWKNHRVSSHDFWGTRRVGEIVHYHNGFQQYVRGVVVDERGVKKMKSIALVGNWRAYDLPVIRADGSIKVSYAVQKIRDGAVSQPDASNMYEYSDYLRRGGIDPTKLPAIDISDPVPSHEHKRAARLNELRNNIISMLQEVNGGTPEEFIAAAEQALATAKRCLAKHPVIIWES